MPETDAAPAGSRPDAAAGPETVAGPDGSRPETVAGPEAAAPETVAATTIAGADGSRPETVAPETVAGPDGSRPDAVAVEAETTATKPETTVTAPEPKPRSKPKSKSRPRPKTAAKKSAAPRPDPPTAAPDDNPTATSTDELESQTATPATTTDVTSPDNSATTKPSANDAAGTSSADDSAAATDITSPADTTPDAAATSSADDTAGATNDNTSQGDTTATSSADDTVGTTDSTSQDDGTAAASGGDATPDDRATEAAGTPDDSAAEDTATTDDVPSAKTSSADQPAADASADDTASTTEELPAGAGADEAIADAAPADEDTAAADDDAAVEESVAEEVSAGAETASPNETILATDEAPAAALPAETVAIPATGEPVAAPAGRRGWASRRGLYALVGVGTVVALLVGAWAVDSAVSADQVARNVEVAGEAVGGHSEDEVQGVVADIGVAQAQRPVSIDTGDKVYETTAAALGLSVDEPATVDALLDAGSDGNPLLRPFSWLASFVRPRDVSLRYAVDEAQATANLEALQGADRTAPVEPTMPLGEAGFAMVPGQNGQGIDPATFPDLLLEAAGESTDGTIEVDAEVTTLEPAYTDDEVQLLAEQANNISAAGLAVKAGPVEVPVPPAQLRAWIDLAPTDGGLDIAINQEAVNASLPALVGVVGDAPVNATVTLDPNGFPVVVPGLNGVACCGEDSSSRIWEALSTSQPRVELEVREAEPDWTSAEVQGWGITQPIGGSRAWRNGGEVPGPAPGFTTYHDCCASRVRNIQRLADMIRGAVIPPGGDFSINDYAGPRTAAKGFVLAGAIAQGQHVDEIGGGVSQFATTMFNAAYFAGLDITEYQAHTEYFSRYPRGREATMGYPRPDLAIHNNSPYGLLIWTSYTETSLTVTFYSTPWATAEQTGISESRHGGCRTVVTTRTRYFPDGTTADDTFKATYRPGEGQFC